MLPTPVKIICKQCGRKADSTSFTLDPVYKKMVCAECVKDRKTQTMLASRKAKDAATPKPVEPPKPAGWDQEDVELERLAREKKATPQAQVQRIDDTKAKVVCAKCQYKFTYNIINQTPHYCPYCGAEIPKVR